MVHQSILLRAVFLGMSSTDPCSSGDADQQSQTEKDVLSEVSIEIKLSRDLVLKLENLPGNLPTYIQQWIQQGYIREAEIVKRWQDLLSIKEKADRWLGKVNYHWLLLLILWLGYGLFINSRDLYDYNLQQIGIEAIVERQHFYLEGSLSPDLQPRQDIFEYDGHLYASKQPGQYLLGAIAYFFLHHLAGMRYVGSYDLTTAWVTFLTASTVTTFATAAVFLLAQQWSARSRYPFWPYLCAASFAIASTAFPYAGIAHHDALATSFLVMGAYFIFSISNTEESGSRKRSIQWIYPILGGICLGLTITTSMLPFFMVVPLSIYFIISQPTKIIRLMGGCL
ncbi:MAG: hypothetical protein HC921_14435 [Synechococcaceae cyanobacterium SM2_3_1]|nr:hypothetical protein [Synechococcaceae cyanobacterium SM2_3_1]